jgi:hypothetical protein
MGFQIQMWQDNDELVAAFLDGRLTHRTMCHPGGHQYNYEGRSDTSLPGIINNDDYYKPILNQAAKLESGGWAKSPTLAEREKTARLDAGGAGIVRRLTPNNFISVPGVKDYCIEVDIKLRESALYADYEETGFLVSQKDFTKDRLEARVPASLGAWRIESSLRPPSPGQARVSKAKRARV